MLNAKLRCIFFNIVRFVFGLKFCCLCLVFNLRMILPISTLPFANKMIPFQNTTHCPHTTYKSFYSGLQEHESFTTLCKLWILFDLLLPGNSVSRYMWFIFSHMSKSASDLRILHSRSPELLSLDLLPLLLHKPP